MAKKNKEQGTFFTNSVDLGGRMVKSVQTMVNTLTYTTWPKIVTYVREQWIKLIVLVMSATQTFAMIDYLAPSWAFWLPWVAILLVEGSIPFWQIRETDADEADGDVEDSKKNEQEKLANGMVWTGLVLMVFTMVGGALIEVSDNETLNAILKPNPGVTGAMGWLALIGVFLFGAVQVWADWQYKRMDPLHKLFREGRARMRKIERVSQRAMLQGEEKVAKSTVRGIRRSFNKLAPEIGKRRANAKMKNVDGVNGNKDIDVVPAAADTTPSKKRTSNHNAKPRNKV